MRTSLKIALFGNPNSGKSSLFNILTGLNQKVGNFPGVTVEKKTGYWQIGKTSHLVIDVPGVYSIYPKTQDEQIALDILMNKNHELHPDVIVVVVDASNLKRNLLLFTQLKDLGLPTILALNMLDVAKTAGIRINSEILKKELGTEVVKINARFGKGIDELASVISRDFFSISTPFFNSELFGTAFIDEIKKEFGLENDYQALLLAQNYTFTSYSPSEKHKVEEIIQRYDFKGKSLQAAETIKRYELINQVFNLSTNKKSGFHPVNSFSSQLDKILTHTIWGYAIFGLILFVIFQGVFSLATIPMDLIDGLFGQLNTLIKGSFPESSLVDLLTDGLLAGLSGVLIFIPQIAILFIFISILEETGYMSRVVFIMDRIMRKFGLNGKSLVPLISGAACAIPAIMATRTIGNRKERLITIFVTPFISCSARIPVFTVLIALIIPEQKFLGIFNTQGLVLMGLYMAGFLMAILSAWAMKHLMVSKEKSYFIMELPPYKLPRFSNVWYTLVEKIKAFVFQAGKIIIAISIVLWVLATYGPSDNMKRAVMDTEQIAKSAGLDEEAKSHLLASKKLESSYAGIIGKSLEPAIIPLGFDWKIGIALVTSFAAREVFIGTISTIYRIGSDESDTRTVIQTLREERNPTTGKAVFNFATGVSLLIFYLLAMQCMSTFAVVYRETNSWAWPIAQLVYMTGTAYLFSFIAFQVLSRWA